MVAVNFLGIDFLFGCRHGFRESWDEDPSPRLRVDRAGRLSYRLRHYGEVE